MKHKYLRKSAVSVIFLEHYHVELLWPLTDFICAFGDYTQG